ncbi:MAG: carboxy terminal-processing peptidase [Gammaproteobacteria bacterium]|nr:carboxy terminal-processing peptidase [Gammaproteobacteria bacterium]
MSICALAPILTYAAIDQQEALEASDRHVKVSRIVTTLFEHSHYRRAKIGNELSSKILDGYLRALDGNRLYFLADDVNGFDKYRFTFDEGVRSGRVEPVFDIFDLYRQRVIERMEFALATLSQEHNFTVDETYYFDREDLPWPDSVSAANEIWRKRVKNDLLGLVMADKTVEEAREVLVKRYNRVIKRTTELNSNEVFETFMNAYADTLDPHSHYFSPRNAKEYDIQMSLEYFGIGASLQMEDEYVTIIEIITGGPASVTGTLEPNDRITGVGQGDSGEIEDVVGWRLDDVVDKIRGPNNTVVRLQILKAGAAPGSAEVIVPFTRGKVTLEAKAAKKEIIEVPRGEQIVKLGVITVPGFYQNFQARINGDKDYTSVTRDVRRLIGELQAENIQGLIMDLRGNGGGQLNEAIDLSGLFIDHGPVVQLREYNGRTRVHKDHDRGVAWDGPLTVLVNRFSASASEIFAAAIQDYGRGVVIGQQTYGKGTVQNVYPLDRQRRAPEQQYGRLNLTMGKYYRVNGGSTQHRGVIPDIELPSLIPLSEVGESTRESALPWDQIETTKYQEVASLYMPDLEYLRSEHLKRQQTDPDLQYLERSIKLSTGVRERKSVSLNLEQRKQEREALDQDRLANENARRAANNMALLESTEELADQDDLDEILEETAEIMADIVTVSSIAAKAKTGNAPQLIEE